MNSIQANRKTAPVLNIEILAHEETIASPQSRIKSAKLKLENKKGLDKQKTKKKDFIYEDPCFFHEIEPQRLVDIYSDN